MPSNIIGLRCLPSNAIRQNILEGYELQISYGIITSACQCGCKMSNVDWFNNSHIRITRSYDLMIDQDYILLPKNKNGRILGKNVPHRLTKLFA